MIMTKTRTRLTMDQKLRALAYIARGDTMSQVAAHMLEDFEVTISESRLYQIKKDNHQTIQKIQERLADSVAADAEKIMQSTRVALARRLQRDSRDGAELEQLDQQYRDGELSKEDYQRQKTGLLQMSVAELVSISRGMHEQVIKAPGSAELDAGPPQNSLGGGSTPAQLEALLKAIQAGNTVEMQRLIFTPKGAHNDQSVTIS